MAHTGINKPCPCGSFKPYGECCRNSETAFFPGGVLKVIDGGLDDSNPPSIDQMNTILTQFVKEENETPRTEFCGLTSGDIYSLFYRPFDSPHIIEFKIDGVKIPESPFTELFYKLLKACEGKGMKLTATGNLPRIFCRETAVAYFTADEKYDDKFIARLISSEPDFDELHTVNIISKMAGFTRKYKGRLLLSKKGKQVLASGLTETDFLSIFRNYTYKFNWAYRDGCADIDFIQTSFLYPLYLLHKFGDNYRKPSFYEEKFMKAFPLALEEVPQYPYSSQEKDLRRCFSMRVLERFTIFFGLTDFKDSTRHFFRKASELKKTAFLDDFITFHR